MSNTHTLRRARAWLVQTFLALLTLATLAAVGAPRAWAEDDPPGRVGRVADVQGSVSMFDSEQGSWAAAERNRPLTSGDRLSTGPKGRAELRIGSTVLRMAAATELEVVRLDDERMSFQLHTGSLAVRVRSREAAADIDLLTSEVRLRPERAGHYRIDRVDDSTQAGVLRGTLRIDDAEGFIIETGQRAELWREGRQQRSLRFAWTNLPNDNFAEWVAREDSRDERSASSRYVSPEMTGAEDLDRNGRWERHAEYGAVWYPIEVRADWAPYRHGRWAWVRPWGWTWVDEASWGFAPFHYGRWVSVSGRWGWWPGEYVARPVYAPALVAWVGGAHVGVSIGIGGPNVGWVPLAPREWYTPHYRHTPVYVERVNPHPPGGRNPQWQRPPQQVPTGPVMYSNQGVPGAVTVVPREVLVRREPVSRAVVEVGGGHQRGHGQPLLTVAPPEHDGRHDGRGPRLVPVPGGAQPAAVPLPAPERDRGPWPQRRADPPPSAAPPPGQGPVIDLRRERQQPPIAAPAAPATAPSVQAVQPVPPALQGPRLRERDAERGGRNDRGDRSDRGERGDRGDSADRGDRESVVPARPMPGPVAQPAPAAPPLAAAPVRPAAGPPAALPPARAPAPAPTVVPAPSRAVPTSPPERAREREAERERAREQSKDEDRKRGPESRGGQRENQRENSRERENQR